MRISIGRKWGNFALSLFLVLFCLGMKALAAENRKASVSSGTLYMVQEDGTVLRYGPGNIHLRKGPFADEVSKVSGLTGIVGIEVGDGHALALDSDGCIWAWGRNKYGTLGFQEEKSLKEPKKIEELCGVSDFDAGHYSTIVLFKEDNSVAFWGASVPEKYQGKRITFEEPIKTVVSYSLSFAITEAGKVYAWGNPDSIEGILDPNEGSPWHPSGLDIPCHVVQIDVGLDVMFICKSGDVYIFGSNTTGTLGIGNTKPVNRITKHPILSGVDKIMGEGIRVAKLKNGKYVGWGDQLLGPIEWTNSGYVLDAVRLYPPTDVVDFYSQESSIFFIHRDGSVPDRNSCHGE